jgi:hypothetical protein
LSLAFSYWIDYVGFITEGKLAAIFIKPSLGVSNWPIIYFINYTPSNAIKSFSGTIHRRATTHSSNAWTKVLSSQVTKAGIKTSHEVDLLGQRHQPTKNNTTIPPTTSHQEHHHS